MISPDPLISHLFYKAIDEIILQKPDVLVHAGDLFDIIKPRTRAYTTVQEALDRLPFIVLAVNPSMVKIRYTTSPSDELKYPPVRSKSGVKNPVLRRQNLPPHIHVRLQPVTIPGTGRVSRAVFF